MKRDDRVYLRHILEAIERIEFYLTDIDKEAFEKGFLIQDGTIRQLEIIGEAVKNLTVDLRDDYANIPWKNMAGMRDKLIHHYFGVAIHIVWLTNKHSRSYNLIFKRL